MKPDALFTIFGRGVHLYGICIAVGILLCFWVLYSYTKKWNMPTEMQDYIFFIGIFGIAVGFLAAMLFQAVYNWIDTGVFNFYSGLTVMGGVIGGAAAFLALYFFVGKFYFKKSKLNLHIKHFKTLINVAPCCITMAHGFGRIGCLMAGCCHGEYLGSEYVFGGIWMKGTVEGYSKLGYYVPTQLYEALFLFALFGVMTFLYHKRYNVNMIVYLIGYGVWRIFIEFFRADSRGELVPGTLSPSQWQSLVFFAIAIAIIVFYKIKKIPFILPKEEKIDEK